MAEQVLKKPQKALEEVVGEETDTKLEARSAVWDQRINLELTRRTMRKTEKKVSRGGEEIRKVEFEEDTDRSLVSYPSPEKIYSREAEKVTAEIGSAEETGEEKASRQRPQLVLMKTDFSRPSMDIEVVEVAASAEELAPTTEAAEREDAVQERVFEVDEVEGFSFEVATGRIPVEDKPTRENGYKKTGAQTYEGKDAESFSPPESPVEKAFTPSLEIGKDYQSVPEPEISGRGDDYERFLPLLKDFETAEKYESFGNAVFSAEYSEDSEVSERLVMDLEELFPYRDSVTGSEAVETLWSDYGIEATVAEVPYFSENSGKSWEEGWNSFDMVLQMNGMSMLDTEYLSGDLHEVGDLEQPMQNSIDAEFDTGEAIEFRESEEFGGCNSSYEASERTRNAWAEKYGEGILELDATERGIYAAFEEGESFRGAPMEAEESELLSDSAVEML